MSWKQLDSRTVYENPWMEVREDHVINPGGGRNHYGYVHFKNRAIAILPLDDEGNKIFGRDERHHNRKVRYFSGWAAMKRDRIDPEAGEDDWVFMKGLRLHNEGQRVAVVGQDGTETGYSVELARLTYQNTSQPILKLGLVENASGDTVTYIWGEVGATRLGMNLRWFQVGVSAEEGNAP